MKITCNTEKTISKEYAIHIQKLYNGCVSLAEQVKDIIGVNDYGRFVEGVYPRTIVGLPAVRVQLKFGEYNAVIYLQQEKQGAGKIQIHPPKFLSTEKLLDLGNYAEWMSWLATISGTIYREVVWNIPFGDAVKSSAVVESSDDIGVDTSNVGGIGDVNVKDLADLMRAAYLTFNLSNEVSEEELLEWEDAFYCDTTYREGVADYAIANIPKLQEANMSDIHVIADQDDDSSELLFTFCVNGEPVDKIRTWYVHDRWDAFLDEL